MRKGRSRLKRILPVVAVGVLLAVAVTFSDQLGQAVAGALIVVAGVLAISLRGEIVAFQHRLAETGAVSSRWSDSRPLTIILWGGGVILVGAAWLLDAYAHV